MGCLLISFIHTLIYLTSLLGHCSLVFQQITFSKQMFISFWNANQFFDLFRIPGAYFISVVLTYIRMTLLDQVRGTFSVFFLSMANIRSLGRI